MAYNLRNRHFLKLADFTPQESMKDTARVLGRMYDGIEFRGFSQQAAEELAQYSTVPVWNGLTDDYHPTQILADFLTMQEHISKPLSAVSFCFLGDSGNNTGNSLMMGAAKMGMDIRLAGPRSCWPRQETLDASQAVAKETGAKITVTEDAEAAVRRLRLPLHRCMGVDGPAN